MQWRNKALNNGSLEGYQSLAYARDCTEGKKAKARSGKRWRKGCQGGGPQSEAMCDLFFDKDYKINKNSL